MKNFNKFFFCVIFFCLLLNTVNTTAQAPDWVWAKSADETKDSPKPNRTGNGITADKDGNILVIGNAEGQSIFGNDTLFSSQRNGFITKYGPTGNVLWAKSANMYNANDIVTDSKGNIFITGMDHNSKMIIKKYSSNGTELWRHSAGGKSSNDEGRNIATDDEGNIYVTGFFISPNIIFSTDTLQYTTSDKDGYMNMYIVKYNTLGKVLWARSFDAFSTAYTFGNANNLAVDPKGNVYITGTFSNSYITFGDTTLYEGNPDVNYSDMFIVKYDTDGNVLWAKSSGTVMYDMAVAISLDNKGSFYIVGYFDSGITFGTTTLTHPDSLTLHMFIVKYDSSGTVVWAKADGEGYCHDILTDSNGNFYITGDYYKSPATFGNITLNKIAERDMYIVKYNSEGTALWGKSVGGSRMDAGNALAVDKKGDVYVTGYFQTGYSQSNESVNFGSTALKEDSGSQDVFVAKISGTTGIKEIIVDKFQNKVFPNPAKSTFHISGIENDNMKIKIYSLTGEKIHESFLKDSPIIDLSGKAKGMYIYQLQKEGEVFKTGKLVLE